MIFDNHKGSQIGRVSQEQKYFREKLDVFDSFDRYNDVLNL